MAFAETKVYFDGSHYIAIPHTTNPHKRPIIKRKEQTYDYICKTSENTDKNSEIEENNKLNFNLDNKIKIKNNDANNNIQPKNIKKLTKKEIFETLYMEFSNLNRQKKKEQIILNMLQYFNNETETKNFVNMNFERKLRNLICRKVRMVRKANLANFNYFCTFTYDNKKHNEITFRKKLKTCLRNFCYRKKWKYMGVWERAPETNRLHFHGLFNIPKETIPGTLFEKKDYDTVAHKMQTSIQSSYFNERFGRSDFKPIIEEERILGNALAYLMKYIEKTGEKIVYSKGLPQYFISDIIDEDVICRIGQEDKKLLLYDNFTCFDYGCKVGTVSPSTIEQLRKSN